MKYLRERVLEPILIPLVALVVIAFGALNFSRLFLASAGAGRAVIVASLVSAAILGGAVWATTREHVERGTLLGGAALVSLVLAGAGLLAQDVDLDHAAHGEEGGPVEVASEITIVAVDIDFSAKQVQTAGGGPIRINYRNDGAAPHTLVFEGMEDEFKLETPGGGADGGVIELDPADYVFYCDVPGHRSAGMEGTLTVTEGGDEGGAGGTPEAAPVRVVAEDVDFPEKEYQASSGEVAFEYVNEGVAPHTLAVEGFEEDMKLETSGGGTDEGGLELGPGTYVLYCDIPGHRSAGMEARLTVT